MNFANVESMRAYASGFNLLTFTDFIGDPGTGDEDSSYPQQRTFNLGVEVTF